MASSSSVGSGSPNRVRRRIRSRCNCGDLVGKWTAWTPKNPGRRFIGCPNFRDKTKDCKFFDWVDPGLPNQWYVDLIWELRENGYFENPEFYGEFPAQEPVFPAQLPLVQVAAEEHGKQGGIWKVMFLCCFAVLLIVLLK